MRIITFSIHISRLDTQQGAQAEPSPTLRIAYCFAIVHAMLHSRFGRLSTALGDELDRSMKNEAKERIGVLAQAMLDGTVNYFEGAERILDLRDEVGVYANDPDFVAFIGVLNEVDYLRDEGYSFNWSLLNEASLQDQISESLAWAKSVSLENCKSLANRYKA